MEKIEHLIHQEKTKTLGHTVCEHYFTYCPFCRQKNMFWLHEVNLGKVDSQLSMRCEHFKSLGIRPHVVFSDSFDITCEGKNVFIDGVLVSRGGVGSILDNILYRREEVVCKGISYIGDEIIRKVTQTEARLFFLERFLENHPPTEIVTYQI